MGDWKAVRNGRESAIELYDLSQDVGEQRNVADRHPDRAAQARQIMEEAEK
jgi:hypothetical protein